MTRSVRDAVLAHEVLAQRRVLRAQAPLASYRLAVPTTAMLDGLEPAVARAFELAIERLRRAGARIEEIALPEIADLGSIQSAGGFAAAESYAWHQDLLAAKGEGYDPRVRTRIERGADMPAHAYVKLVWARQDWIARVGRAVAGFDALLSPTTPLVAPTIASLAPADGLDPAADAARDAEFFRVNALLLRNPSVVNMLDGCALSLPCHAHWRDAGGPDGLAGTDARRHRAQRRPAGRKGTGRLISRRPSSPPGPDACAGTSRRSTPAQA